MSSPGQDLPEDTVTVLFTDLVGSTQLNQQLGDEAAGALESTSLRRPFTACFPSTYLPAEARWIS